MTWKNTLHYFVVVATLAGCASGPKPKSDNFTDVGLMMDRKVDIFDRLVVEINRLDGDGRIFRLNRPESWEQTVGSLRSEMRHARELPQVGRVFKRLDATYANIGSQVYLNSDLEPSHGQGKVLLGFKMVPTIDSVNQHDFRLYISDIDKSLWASAPNAKVGDEIIEINGHETNYWFDRNLVFCKFPLEVQCALELEENFRNELLDWDHSQPIQMRIIHGAEKVTLQVPFRFSTPQDVDRDDRGFDLRNDSYPCGIDLKRRYPDFGFVYKGRNACVLESHAHPGIAILRISSFSYPDSAELIRTIRQEIEQLVKSYWKAHSGSVKHLIIDVMDNDSPESPTLYESLLFDKPFQDQYIRFKKVTELNDPDFQENVFFNDLDGGKAIWLKAIKEDGSLDSTPFGQFLDPVPRYCVSPKLDCRVGKFEPFEQKFKGQIHVLVNQYCRSGCVDFVYSLGVHLDERVDFYGISDSGESTFSHLNIKMALDPSSKGGFTVKTVPNGRSPGEGTKDFVLSQRVSVTETTTESGKLLSGIPQTLKGVAPINFKNYPEGYIRDTLKEILTNISKK